MGEEFDRLQSLDDQFIMNTYARKPVAFVRGEGMRLYDEAGREYLDFVAGIGSVNLGHAHPAVSAAVCEQSSRLVQVSNLYYTEHRAEAAEGLVGLLGGGMKIFFANSGAEAIEGAIKLARRWGGEHKPNATRILSAQRSFHGRTLAALAATGQPSKHEAFLPLPQGFAHVPFNDGPNLELVVDETVTALILELIQGEGGVWPATAEFVNTARDICNDTGTLLIIDEIQTGFFRTGTAFAHQAFGIKPDIVTVAKAMANGLPIGAVAATDEVAAAFQPGDHGSTFGGGPVITAAARATMDALVTGGFGRNAREVGGYLRDGLRALATATGAIGDVRGAGLMIGAELKARVAAQVVDSLLERGIIVNNLGDKTLRFLPPLVCGRSEIDTLMGALTEVLQEVGSR